MPDFAAMNFYVDTLLTDVGEKAGESGRTDDALAAYESVARFGERLESASFYNWQLVSAAKCRKDAYQNMIPLLRRQGRTEQAAELESTLAALKETGVKRPSNVVEERSAHIVQLSGLSVYLLLVVTVAWLVALGPLRWKPNSIPGLDRLASILSVAPVLLLLSSLALFVGYYPYARSIAEYVSVEELQEGFGPFFMGVYGFPDLGAFTEVLPRMFWPSIWCALVAVVGACSLWLVRRLRPIHPDEA